MGVRVEGPDGALGFVVDARFVLDGEPDGLLAGAQLGALVVGPRRREAFLGYERTGVRRPALLAAWFRRRERGAFLVAWEDVARVGDDVLELRDGFTRWSTRLEMT